MWLSTGYNIGYGAYSRNVEGATDEEVEEATKAASLDAFVRRQPEGYATKVGERGLRLSGGEKQRTAIARAILKQSAIVVYDEATSALDTQTESEIQRELDHVSLGRSSITIAHRLSTIANADLILVLDAGRIVEQGTHDELIAMGGQYAGMWSRQERAKALEGELQRLVEVGKAKAKLQVIEEEKDMFPGEEKEGEEERKEGGQQAHGGGGGASVALDVQEEEEEEEEEGEALARKKSKKKKGKGGDDLSASLLG